MELGITVLVVLMSYVAAQYYNTTTVHVHADLIIAVYSDGSFDWHSALVQHNGSHIPSSEVEFIQFQSRRNFDMEDIRTAKHLLEAHLQPITGIIGSYHPSIKTVAEDLKVPYLVTSQWQRHQDYVGPDRYTFYLAPPPSTLHRAVSDILHAYGWREAAILHSDDRGIELIGLLMQTSPRFLPRGWRITDLESLSSILLNVRQNNLRNIVTICDAAMQELILNQAMQLSMVSKSYAWLAVTLEPHKVDFSRFLFSHVNFTTFHMPGEEIDRHDDLELTLVKDAVRVLQLASASAGKDAGDAGCDDSTNCDTWSVENALKNTLIKETFNVSGQTIDFDTSNRRINMSLTILALGEEGLQEVGEWSEHEAKVTFHVDADELYGENRYPLGKETVKIVTYVEAPFVLRDPNGTQPEAPFKGFLVDLIDEIAYILNFTYTMYESPDGNYGLRNDEGEWNGMMHELITGNASLCVAALAISSEREEAIDFTKPYKAKTLTVLVKRTPESRSIFEFLYPLAFEVWALMFCAMIGLGVLLFLLDLAIPNSEIKDERFSLKESIWFMYGSLVGGGLDLGPRTFSGRLLSGTWWFFALIMVSSYTANLAAFLTVTKIDTPVNSLTDLVNQKAIQYGTVRNTNVNMFFKNSKLPIFQKMWNVMEVNDALVDNPEEAIRRVKNGDYAFIWDQPSLKYVAEHECDTMMIGEPFDEKGYGIGVPLGASYRDDITMAILHLNERGVIQNLEKKWWGQETTCAHIRKAADGKTKELGLYSIAGIFLIVCGGATLALAVCGLEYQYHKHVASTKKQKQNSHHHDHHDHPHQPQQRKDIPTTAICASDNEGEDDEEGEESNPQHQFAGYSVRYRKRMSIRQHSRRNKASEAPAKPMGNRLEVSAAEHM